MTAPPAEPGSGSLHRRRSPHTTAGAGRASSCPRHFHQVRMERRAAAQIGYAVARQHVHAPAVWMKAVPPDSLDHDHARSGRVRHAGGEPRRAARALDGDRGAVRDPAPLRVFLRQHHGRRPLPAPQERRLAEGRVQKEPVRRHEALQRVARHERTVLGPLVERHVRRQRGQPLPREPLRVELDPPRGGRRAVGERRVRTRQAHPDPAPGKELLEGDPPHRRVAPRQELADQRLRALRVVLPGDAHRARQELKHLPVRLRLALGRQRRLGELERELPVGAVEVEVLQRGRRRQDEVGIEGGGGEGRQAREGAARHPPVVVTRDPDADADEGPWARPVAPGEPDDRRDVEADDRRDRLRGIRLHVLGEPLDAERRPLDVVAVEVTLRDQDVHHGERQRRVGARADHEVEVRLLGGRRAIRIDDDDEGAAGARLLDERHHVDRRVGRIHAPEDDQVRTHHLLRVVAGDGAQGGAPARVRGVDADRAVQAARTERVEEGVARVVLDLAHRPRVRERQDRLGADGAEDLVPAPSDLVDRLVPGDRHELAPPLRAHPPERGEHTQRRMNALGIFAHLAADHPLREGMVAVARDTRETAVLDGEDEAAGGRTVVRTDGQHAAFKGIMAAVMFGWLVRLNPFKTPDTQRLAVLFGVVYFAQGMWYLPNQTITIVLKERGLSAGQVADFFLISTVPWLVKPLYGLISDFVPLFGRRRKSYFLVTSGLAALAGLLLASGSPISDGTIEKLGVTLPIVGTVSFTLVAGVWLFTLMALGLAFTDVLVDAMMVEIGRPRGLTGAFQSVQWACITVASVLVVVVGGRLAESRSLRAAFLLAACFPLISMLMGAFFVSEPRATFDREAFRQTLGAIREALAHRDMWLVACFILFWTFSPSFGPAFLYYQTDTLGFSQQFIGTLGSLSAIAGVVGATIYAPISRRFPLKRIVNAVIGLGVAGTLAYLLYRGAASALVIDTVFGCVGMITQLALLDLAAKSCPSRSKATSSALPFSFSNA